MEAEPRLKVAMAAGEASGDLLAAAVLRGLGAHGGCKSAGIGGPAMAAQGFDCWWSIDALSVRGYAEVLMALPRLLRMRSQLDERIRHWRPEVFVGVDAPDFNLTLETRLRQAGIPVVHFISPSIWAWRAERIEAIKRAVDHMLLVFPFEKKLYDTAGIPATYVGHPLADAIALNVDRDAASRALGLNPGRPTVALLPGSRPDEIRYMGQLFIDTAAWMHARRPDIQFVLPAAGARLFETLRARISHGSNRELPLTLVQGRSHQAMAAADAVLVASGTASLEAALLRKPMVIAYKMAWLSYHLMKNKGYLPWIGLPNILAGESLVPEFIQQQASAPVLGLTLLNQLDDESLRARLAERFAEIHQSLRRDCASRAADQIHEIVDARRHASTH
jgi:lipid-A-disaccharide synthase